MEATDGLVHQFIDLTSVPPWAIRNMERLHVVIIHLEITNIDHRLQVTIELLAATAVVLDVRPRAQPAPVDKIALPTVRVEESL